MSTVEDFENAPFGATADRDDGSRAVKMSNGERCWILQTGIRHDDEQMAVWGYTLDPSAPDTAREALDLAWELAHPVKEGQVIPEGTQLLELHGHQLNEYTSVIDHTVSPNLAPITRTFDPLPDPEPELPDWIDAPAVIAVHDSYTKPSIWGKHWDQESLAEYYQSALTAGTAHWSELRDVTPLYPEEEEGEWVSL